jgi:hypothetical protein
VINPFAAASEIEEAVDYIYELEGQDGLEVIREGDWTQDHKYQHREDIVRYKGILLGVSQGRSGSYHTDWYYDDLEAYPVVEETVTSVVYKRVKN